MTIPLDDFFFSSGVYKTVACFFFFTRIITNIIATIITTPTGIHTAKIMICVVVKLIDEDWDELVTVSGTERISGVEMLVIIVEMHLWKITA